MNANQERPIRINTANLRAVPAPPTRASQLELLFQEHYDRVYRVAFRVTGSTADAEDVLQTVFLRLARRGDEFSLEPNPAAYLHRAAINAALDLLRQRGRMGTTVTLADADHELLASRAANPEALQRDSEIRQALRRALSSLNQNQAEMFVLRYFEGLDNQEIAAQLNTSPLVVGVLLHRARTKVKQFVGDFLEGANS